MSKKKMFIIGVVVVLLIAAYLMFFYKKDNGIDKLFQNAKFPLQVGSEGPEVRELQQYLIMQGANLPEFGVDGVFGNETLNAFHEVFGNDKSSLSYEEFQQIKA